MNPDLELVQVRDDESFKVWSHGYPYRTVRWHFHPEYELHLVTTTEGARYVGDHIGPFGPGDLVFVGPNLPHNWISEVPAAEAVPERCIVLQFTEALITSCLATFLELRPLRSLLSDAFRGVRFDPALAHRLASPMRELLEATGARRISLFIEVLDLVGQASNRMPLASIGFRPNPSVYLTGAMNLVLQHIDRNLVGNLNEPDVAKLANQSVSGFSRSFRRHTGMTFVQYVNSLRIELACQYLGQGELTVAEICYEVGFNNVSNFNRQFLALKGMPPSKFRSLRRGGARLASAA